MFFLDNKRYIYIKSVSYPVERNHTRNRVVVKKERVNPVIIKVYSELDNENNSSRIVTFKSHSSFTLFY